MNTGLYDSPAKLREQSLDMLRIVVNGLKRRYLERFANPVYLSKPFPSLFKDSVIVVMAECRHFGGIHVNRRLPTLTCIKTAFDVDELLACPPREFVDFVDMRLYVQAEKCHALFAMTIIGRQQRHGPSQGVTWPASY